MGDGLKLTPSIEGVKPPPQVVAGNNGEIYAIYGEYARGGSRDVREGNAPPAHIRMGIDRKNGNLYAVWENMSSAGDPVQISLIRSTDGGRTSAGAG